MTAYYDEFYICSRAHECDDRGDCSHSTAHDPDELDDNCLDDPCPGDFDDDQFREIYCIPLSEYVPEAKPVIIILEDDLFDI